MHLQGGLRQISLPDLSSSSGSWHLFFMWVQFAPIHNSGSRSNQYTNVWFGEFMPSVLFKLYAAKKFTEDSIPESLHEHLTTTHLIHTMSRESWPLSRRLTLKLIIAIVLFSSRTHCLLYSLTLIFISFFTGQPLQFHTGKLCKRTLCLCIDRGNS